MATRVAGGGATIRDRLRVARGRRFVGREAELELFREAVEAVEPEFAVLWIHGPGGVGKTTLLEAFARIAAGAGVEPLQIDLRAIEPAPPAFEAALAEAAGVSPGEDPAEALADGARSVLLLDTYEVAAALDGWLRESFLPDLPARTVTVIAGRTPPGQEWVIDAGWRDALRALSLSATSTATTRARSSACPVSTSRCTTARSR